MPELEHLVTYTHEGYKVIDASFAGHDVTLERHKDWLTTAYWTLPDEYSFEDFLRVCEEMFKEAEQHGYESDPPNHVDVAIGSPKLDDISTYEAVRPVEATDFAEIGLTAGDVNFIRLSSDLAHFTFMRRDRQVGLLFYEKPHQLRSAFHFMAELLPPGSGLEPKQIGTFVLGLPR